MNTQGPALLSICAVTLVITCLVVNVLFPWEQTFMARTSLGSQLCFFSLTQFLVFCKLFTPREKNKELGGHCDSLLADVRKIQVTFASDH